MSYRKILFIIKTAFRVTNVIALAFVALLIFNFWIAASVLVHFLHPLEYLLQEFEPFFDDYHMAIWIILYIYTYIISTLICLLSFYIKVFLKLSKVEFYIVIFLLYIIYSSYILFNVFFS